MPRSKRTPAIDAWVRSVQRVEDSRIELGRALDDLEPWIVDAVEAVAGGESLAELVARTRLRTRRRLAGALGTMSSALAENRIAAIRVIVDDEHLTMTEAARLFGVPRQVLSRLYHGAS